VSLVSEPVPAVRYDVYKVFVIFHFTRIFIYFFFDFYIQKSLQFPRKRRRFRCLKFFSKVNIFELEKIVCRNLGTAINMLMIRNKRKQDRSCIKFTLTGFLDGKFILRYLAYYWLGRTNIR